MEQNPTHIFYRQGLHTITLRIWDSGGAEAKVQKQLVVVGPVEPNASFTYTPAAPVAGEEVQFTDTSIGPPTSWEWEFDDGGESTLQNPSHIFDEAGEYNVELRVSNDQGSDDEIVRVTIHASAQTPEAGFVFSPTNPAAGEVVRFFDTSGGGTADSWEWDFGDGGSSNEQYVGHTFTAEGSYDVTLTVGNSAGDDSIVQTVDVAAEVPPIDPDLEQVTFLSSAARTGGVGDSFFVTDVDVNNSGDSMATYKVAWLPSDTDNSSPTVSDELTIEAGETVRWGDVLGNVFGVPDGPDAVGALAFVSDSAELKVFSRTYNSSDAGTFGQAIPGVSEDDLIPTGTTRRILFFTENAAYRSSLGFLNGTSKSLTIKWRRYTADGMMVDESSVALPAWGNTQFNRVFGPDAPVEGGYVDVWTDTDGGAFTAYGSVLDNDTSDPTTVLPD